MPGNLRKATRGAAKKNHSTVGGQSIASQRTRQVAAPLDDPREERFVQLYVESSNGVQSAIAAGFPPRSARTLASRLLKKVYIKDAIARRNAKFLQRYEATPDRIVRELAKIGFANLEDFFAVQPENDAQHAMRRRMLRPHVDYEFVRVEISLILRSQIERRECP